MYHQHTEQQKLNRERDSVIISVRSSQMHPLTHWFFLHEVPQLCLQNKTSITYSCHHWSGSSKAINNKKDVCTSCLHKLRIGISVSSLTCRWREHVRGEYLQWRTRASMNAKILDKMLNSCGSCDHTQCGLFSSSGVMSSLLFLWASGPSLYTPCKPKEGLRGWVTHYLKVTCTYDLIVWGLRQIGIGEQQKQRTKGLLVVCSVVHKMTGIFSFLTHRLLVSTWQPLIQWVHE